MNERDLLRDGRPIVCLAHHAAFRQEADSLRVLFGDNPGPVPRISIEIVPNLPAPDAAAEKGEPAKASGKKGGA